MNVCRWQSCVSRIKSLLYLTACHMQSSSLGFFNDFLLKQNQNKLIFCVARVTFGSSDLTRYDSSLFIMFPRVVYIWFLNTFKTSYIRFFFDFIQRAHGISLYFNPDICHLNNFYSNPDWILFQMLKSFLLTSWWVHHLNCLHLSISFCFLLNTHSYLVL